jgi:hypothetical protein
MRLSEQAVGIMEKIMIFERDSSMTEALNKVTFYAWLERLSRSCAENISTTTRVFEDIILGKFLALFRTFKRSPYLSDEA